MYSKKKIIGFLIAAGVLTITFAANVFAGNAGVINGDSINVRAEASTDSAIITTLNSGQAVDIVGAEGDWFKIKQNDGSTAFVTTQFVKITKAEGVVVDDSVNVRALSNTNSEIVAKLNAGAYVTVTGSIGDFYSIDYNGKPSFIHKDFVLGSLIKYLGQSPEAVSLVVSASSAPAAEKPESASEELLMPEEVPKAAPDSFYVLVTEAEGINLRSQPSQDSEIIAKLPQDEAMDILEASSQWHKVSYEGLVGYVSSEFVSINQGQKPDNSRGAKIISYAKQFLGTPYVWGGTNLKSGVDCSGFVYSVMKNFGITLNRSSRDQINNGTNVSKDKLKVGDLVFFDTTNSRNRGYISHVGIYMGGGQFIHSSSSRKSYCVTISSLYEDYYIMRYVGATRVL